MESLANITLAEKPAKCERHGPYMTRLLAERPKEVWSFCPGCQAEIKAERAREEEALKKRKLEGNLKEAGILRRFRDATFGTYGPQTEGQARIHEAVMDYAANFEDHLEAGRCLVIVGGPGQGKTHLGVSLLKEIIYWGWTAVYCREYDFFRAVKETWSGGGNRQTERAIVEHFVKPDLLILDEIGVQFFSRAEGALIFQIIENRYGAVKPTMAISNLPGPPPNKSRSGDGRPLNRTKVEDIEDALGFRAYDRLVERGGILLSFPPGQPSYRRQEAVLQ